jgi:hypothetical protein
VDGGVRLQAALVVPLAAGGARVGIVVDGKPFLGEVAEPWAVGRGGSAHPGGHPPGFDCVGQHVGPQTGEGSDERVTKSLLSG